MEKSDFMKADSFRFSNLSPLVVSVILASAVCGSCGSESGTTAKGGDYTPEQVAGREYAGEVRIIEFEDGYSTTGVVEKIAKMVKEGKL